MKKKITLQKAYELIESSAAIIIDNNTLMYPCLDELNGEPDNEWLYCSWNDDYNDYYIKFIEEDQDIFFDGSTITMKDSEDDLIEIKLLVPMNLKDY